MCVGFSNGYDDFKPSQSESALKAMVPGSAVSFDRIGFFHFALFLGWAWPKGGDVEPIPLLCHFSGSKKRYIRLEDFRSVVENSTIRVYRCKCDERKRAAIISKGFDRVGEAEYNLAQNNCEHFVRDLIDGKPISYQARWTLAAPIVQLPRLLVGKLAALINASASHPLPSVGGYKLTNGELGLFDPTFNFYVLTVSEGGLEVSVKLNSSCTREFTGPYQSALQAMWQCDNCEPSSPLVVCKSCLETCHVSCKTTEGFKTDSICYCTHKKKPGIKGKGGESSESRHRHRLMTMEEEIAGLSPSLQQVIKRNQKL